MSVLDLGLAVLALPVLAAAGYLLALTLASRRVRPPDPRQPRWRFDLIVPAHDEEAGIARTVENLLSVDYPAGLRRVIVVADNCQDATAARAREAGAEVLVRVDPTRRGKGYALEHAFARALRDGFADAVIVVDADSTVSPNLLRAFSARLDAGLQALQAEYGVLNPDASWRTRLMTLAFALFHGVRSQGRERLGLSAGLRGNGMCFTTRLLRAYPHRAFSVVEDVEYGLLLGEAGVRVAYVAEAHVLGEMARSSDAARSQRLRWEEGRRLLRRERAWPLLRDGWTRMDPVRIDLALDLLLPPLSMLVAVTMAGFFAAAGIALRTGSALALALWGVALAALSVHALRGWQLSGLGTRAFSAFAAVPAYIVWKLWVRVRAPRAAATQWVRTSREG